ncbi:hypothetical protein [Hyella patelloides]|uniref:hypothetical protein n=1 Tax=Hyella patelloides TaxID=1982969 RepID=UPI0011AA89CF|nr:hypothetical protein [Hyella patelloides]
MLKLNFCSQKERKWLDKTAIFPRKYLIFLVIVMTAASINYFYSLAMMLLTTFIFAYLTKGSRCK